MTEAQARTQGQTLKILIARAKATPEQIAARNPRTQERLVDKGEGEKLLPSEFAKRMNVDTRTVDRWVMDMTPMSEQEVETAAGILKISDQHKSILAKAAEKLRLKAQEQEAAEAVEAAYYDRVQAQVEKVGKMIRKVRDITKPREDELAARKGVLRRKKSCCVLSWLDAWVSIYVYLVPWRIAGILQQSRRESLPM